MLAPYFQFHVAVYLIAREGNKVLLARRYNTGWMDGMYTLPAGHVERDETVQEATAREAKEEVDLDVRPDDLAFVHVMQRHAGEREYIDFFLEASEWSGTPRNNEPDKCDHVDWFDVDALPENTLEYVALALKHGAKQSFSTFGFSSSA